MSEDKKFEILTARCIQETEPMWNSIVTVTEWINGEGFDLNISNNSSSGIISIAYWEYYLLKKMVKKLDKTPFSN